MQIGVVFTQTENGAEVGVVRAYAEAVEEPGYEHLVAGAGCGIRTERE